MELYTLQREVLKNFLPPDTAGLRSSGQESRGREPEPHFRDDGLIQRQPGGVRAQVQEGYQAGPGFSAAVSSHVQQYRVRHPPGLVRVWYLAGTLGHVDVRPKVPIAMVRGCTSGSHGSSNKYKVRLPLTSKGKIPLKLALVFVAPSVTFGYPCARAPPRRALLAFVVISWVFDATRALVANAYCRSRMPYLVCVPLMLPRSLPLLYSRDAA